MPKPIPIYPTYSGVEGLKRFPPREIVHDTTRRIRFVNVQTIGAAASPQKGMRFLRGVMTVANLPPKKGTEEWRWEATGLPLQGFYVWDAIILHPPKNILESGDFTKDRLDELALKADTHGFTLTEEIAHFMVGCLTAFGARYQAEIAKDMAFVPPVEKFET